MKKTVFALTALWTALGLAGGLAYREITKAAEFTGSTQLAVVHTHLLTLGTIIGFVLLVLEQVFRLSRYRRTMVAGLITWNLGLVITSTMMAFHGVQQIDGVASTPMTAGISGLGHMLLTTGFVLFFVALGRRVVLDKDVAPTAAATPVMG
ncbi:DUF2871 domain-containing protein [Propionibacteriaceae bacterium Y2011]|uniref:DUF2871 domain-containing protein n=1 Tax=Microlunatus sp. Y2014 TaxID=3418488 RepID=UPI003B4B840A